MPEENPVITALLFELLEEVHDLKFMLRNKEEESEDSPINPSIESPMLDMSIFDSMDDISFL